MANLNETPSGERLRIGFFGVRNAGKSSLVNAVCGQEVAVVSDVPGTTTDAVRKAMELLPIGPVTIIDTPGIDDEGALGQLRVAKTRQELASVDVAVLVIDGTRGVCQADRDLEALFQERDVPYVVAFTKADVCDAADALFDERSSVPHVAVSSCMGAGVLSLKETIARVAGAAHNERRLLADLVCPGEAVVLVCPIDAAAPKGRIILPQVQVIRDLLDAHAIPAVCQPEELSATLAALVHPPALVVTDSQVFAQVAAIVPETIPLTSFSILMARYKADLATQVAGAYALDVLCDGDRILISEGCTHHRQCDDIGTVKMPAWIRAYTQAQLEFDFTSGQGFPEDVTPYALVVHCGACMLTPRQVETRMRQAQAAGVPFTNYGVAIAKMHGILPRVLSPFNLPADA